MKKSFRNDIKKLGLPTISLKINETPFRFLVDSGSTENYITKTALDMVSQSAELLGRTSTYGIDGVESIQEVVKLSYVLGGREKTQGFGVFTGGTFDKIQQEMGIRIDGVLGLPFMLVNRVNIDYANMCIEYHPSKDNKGPLWCMIPDSRNKSKKG